MASEDEDGNNAGELCAVDSVWKEGELLVFLEVLNSIPSSGSSTVELEAMIYPGAITFSLGFGSS